MPKLKNPVELAPEYRKDSGSGLTGRPESASEGVYVSLPDVAGLDSLPSSGEITFHYCRKTMTLGEEGKLSANLVLCRILAVKADPDADEEPMADAVDKLFEEAQKAEAEESKGEGDESE